MRPGRICRRDQMADQRRFEREPGMRVARRRFNGQARNIVAVESKTVGYR